MNTYIVHPDYLDTCADDREVKRAETLIALELEKAHLHEVVQVFISDDENLGRPLSYASLAVIEAVEAALATFEKEVEAKNTAQRESGLTSSEKLIRDLAVWLEHWNNGDMSKAYDFLIATAEDAQLICDHEAIDYKSDYLWPL